MSPNIPRNLVRRYATTDPYRIAKYMRCEVMLAPLPWTVSAGKSNNLWKIRPTDTSSLVLLSLLALPGSDALQTMPMISLSLSEIPRSSSAASSDTTLRMTAKSQTKKSRPPSQDSCSLPHQPWPLPLFICAMDARMA